MLVALRDENRVSGEGYRATRNKLIASVAQVCIAACEDKERKLTLAAQLPGKKPPSEKKITLAVVQYVSGGPNLNERKAASEITRAINPMIQEKLSTVEILTRLNGPGGVTALARLGSTRRVADRYKNDVKVTCVLEPAVKDVLPKLGDPPLKVIAYLNPTTKGLILTAREPYPAQLEDGVRDMAATPPWRDEYWHDDANFELDPRQKRAAGRQKLGATYSCVLAAGGQNDLLAARIADCRPDSRCGSGACPQCGRAFQRFVMDRIFRMVEGNWTDLVSVSICPTSEKAHRSAASGHRRIRRQELVGGHARRCWP